MFALGIAVVLLMAAMLTRARPRSSGAGAGAGAGVLSTLLAAAGVTEGRPSLAAPGALAAGVDVERPSAPDVVPRAPLAPRALVVPAACAAARAAAIVRLARSRLSRAIAALLRRAVAACAVWPSSIPGDSPGPSAPVPPPPAATSAV